MDLSHELWLCAKCHLLLGVDTEGGEYSRGVDRKSRPDGGLHPDTQPSYKDKLPKPQTKRDCLDKGTINRFWFVFFPCVILGLFNLYNWRRGAAGLSSGWNQSGLAHQWNIFMFISCPNQPHITSNHTNTLTDSVPSQLFSSHIALQWTYDVATLQTIYTWLFSDVKFTAKIFPCCKMATSYSLSLFLFI